MAKHSEEVIVSGTFDMLSEEEILFIVLKEFTAPKANFQPCVIFNLEMA